jgi:hypothetical protein
MIEQSTLIAELGMGIVDILTDKDNTSIIYHKY